MSLDRTSARFETTSWTLVQALATEDCEQRQVALDRLVEIYWPAVYGYLRRRGRSRDEAAEATQAFFADVVLWRGLFERADQDRGRLRTLMLAALRRYQTDQARRMDARGGRAEFSPQLLDEIERELVRSSDMTPDSAFLRNWAAALISEARRRCEHYFMQRGRPGHWSAFEARVLRPAVTAVTPPSMAEVASQHGFRTAADAAAAVQAVRKRLLALLRQVVAETARNAAEADAEYRWLITELS